MEKGVHLPAIEHEWRASSTSLLTPSFSIRLARPMKRGRFLATGPARRSNLFTAICASFRNPTFAFSEGPDVRPPASNGDIRRRQRAAGRDGTHGSDQPSGCSVLREKTARRRSAPARPAPGRRAPGEHYVAIPSAADLTAPDRRYPALRYRRYRPAPAARQARQRLTTGTKPHDLKIGFEPQKLGKATIR